MSSNEVNEALKVDKIQGMPASDLNKAKTLLLASSVIGVGALGLGATLRPNSNRLLRYLTKGQTPLKPPKQSTIKTAWASRARLLW